MALLLSWSTLKARSGCTFDDCVSDNQKAPDSEDELWEIQTACSDWEAHISQMLGSHLCYLCGWSRASEKERELQDFLCWVGPGKEITGFKPDSMGFVGPGDKI